MNRHLARASVAAGVLACVIALTPATSNAGSPIMISVSGTATCGTAGPVGRYTLNWTVTNNSSAAVQITSAVESGAFVGNVTFTPNPIPASQSATGSDGPVDNTSGVVTLTVDASIVGGPSTQVTGTIQLAGNCVIPTTTTTATVAPSSTSTTKTTARAVVVSPRFTG